LKPGIGTMIIVISLFSWMNIARLVRVETLTIKERDFIFYSEFIGLSVIKILTKHILPQMVSVIAVAATANLSNAIMMESALSFLGLGIQQPQNSWGSLLESAQSSLQEAPYMALTPGILIIMTVLCCNQLSNFLQLVFSNEG
ncbi:ABC transporter permease, partial [Enterococcus pseudoavium]|uniref:ABC transporter permease n=1 Tax=Enterococcus pseudoavium TaxID=44007 RepID=UPI003F953609